MIQSFFIPFFSICVAEFLDKSQLTILLLGSKTKNHLQLFVGCMLAFAIVDGSAILFGSFLPSYLPFSWIRIASGILFLVFGIMAFRKETEEAKDTKHIANPFFAGFFLVFLAEWGDKTQLAAAIFATTYHPLLVFAGVMAAMALLSLSALYAGKFIATRVKRHVITKISGTLFILLGLSFLLF